MKVIKRSGVEESFDSSKILKAISKANNTLGEDDKMDDLRLKAIIQRVTSDCSKLDQGSVATTFIDDTVEKYLMKADAFKLAKLYITYRYEKEKSRNKANLKEKLTASNVQNQNANVDEHSFGGRMGETAEYILKEYALNNLVSAKSKRNHNNNEIYIHDLSHYALGDHNCLSVPIDVLLEKGFNTRQTDVRGAKSLNTAFQLVAVLFQLQSLQQFGGVSATHLDWSMVPYFRLSFYKHYKDGSKFIDKKEFTSSNAEIRKTSINNKDIYNMSKDVYNYALHKTLEELNQAVEGMYHNLNTLQSRSGNQLPFSSVNYGTCTSAEGRFIIKALLDGSLKGTGKYHKTAIFPCGIFQLKTGVNRKPGDPNYDLFQLALKSTAIRLYPNYANCDWSGNQGEDKVKEIKNAFIDSLSDEDKERFIDACEKNPEILDKLGLKFTETIEQH